MAGEEEEEFEEEEIWAAAARDPHAARSGKGKDAEGSSRPRPHPAPHPANASRGPRQQSSPVRVPDWAKIYQRGKGRANGGDEEEEEEEVEVAVPPHEWLARKTARSGRISSASVCEGAGRTLKGRDLSRVRNAVLTKTGFLE